MIWFKFYSAWGEGIAELSDAEAGRFVKAVCRYADSGENPSLSGNERVLFAMARKQIEQDKERSEKTSKVRAEVGRLGGISSSEQRQAIASKNNQLQPIASDDKQLQPNAFNKELRIKNEELRTKNEDKPATAKTPKPVKHRHGEYSHVFLTDEQFTKLQDKFPNDYQKRIQNLDDYLQQHQSKHYDDHYLTILTWARKDDEQKAKQPVQQKQPEPYKSTYQRLKEMGEI